MATTKSAFQLAKEPGLSCARQPNSVEKIDIFDSILPYWCIHTPDEGEALEVKLKRMDFSPFIIGGLIGAAIFALLSLVSAKAKRKQEIAGVARVEVSARLELHRLMLQIHNNTEFVLRYVDVEVSEQRNDEIVSRIFRVVNFGDPFRYERYAAKPFQGYEVEIKVHPFGRSELSSKSVNISIIR